MSNYTAQYLADFMEKNKISVEDISEKLNIPVNAIIPGTREKLDSDDFLKICSYLNIRPEEIMKEMEMK